MLGRGNELGQALRGVLGIPRQAIAVIKSLGREVSALGKRLARFAGNTIRIHYDFFGAYTFDVEKEIFNDEGARSPPFSSLTTIEKLGQLVIFPVPILSWISSVTWVPFLGNSIQSIPKGFVSIANLTLSDLPAGWQFEYPTVFETNTGIDQRNRWRRWLYGAPGYLIGGGIGLALAAVVGVGHAFYDNAYTIARSFAWFTNKVLPENVGPILANQNVYLAANHRGWSKFVILPGLLLGGACGLLIGMPAVALIRMVVAGCQLIGTLLVNVANIIAICAVAVAQGCVWLVSRVAEGIVYSAEAVGNGISDNAYTIARSFAWFTNKVLPENVGPILANQNVYLAANHRGWSKFVILPGLLLGGACGLLIGMPAVVLTRMVVAGCQLIGTALKNIALSFYYTAQLIGEGIVNFISANAYTIGRTFARFTNTALPDGVGPIPAADTYLAATERGWSRLWIVPGLFLGGACGLLVGMPAVVLTRMVVAGCQLIGTLVVNVAHLVARCAVAIAQGCVWLGSRVAEGIVYAAEAVGNFFSANAYTIGRTFARFTNTVLPDGVGPIPAADIYLAATERGWSRLWIVPGIFLGGASGLLIGMPAVVLTRIVVASFKYIALSFFYTAQLIREGVVYSAEAVGNFIRDTAYTIARSFAWFTNLVLPEGVGPIPADPNIFLAANHRAWSKFVIFPGLVLGSACGLLIGMPAVVFGRIVVAGCQLIGTILKNIALSFYYSAQLIGEGIVNFTMENAYTLGRTFAYLTDLVLIEANRYNAGAVFNVEGRPQIMKLLTLPGLAIGAVAGILNVLRIGIGYALVGLGALFVAIGHGIAAVGRGIGDALVDNGRACARTFISIVNIASPYQFDGMRFAVPENHIPWPEHGGIFLGGLFGIITAAVISIIRGLGLFFVHSAKSWVALSGSFMNVAMERMKYQGLAGDDRTTNEKLAGVIGYATVFVTTLPCAVAGYAFRSIPALIGLTLGLVVSLASFTFAFPVKSLSKLVKRGFGIGQRFKKDEGEDRIIQKFKNLYSFLTPFGSFRVGETVEENKSGEKGFLSFVRKCFTLNGSKHTEMLLDQLLEKYRLYQMQEQPGGDKFVDTQEFKAVIESVENEVTLGCFNNADEVTAHQTEVRKMGEFIKQYLDDKWGECATPDFYAPKKQTTWASFFRGYENNNVNDVREGVPAPGFAPA